MPPIPTDHHTRRTYTTKLVKSGKPDKKLDRKKPVLVERRIINHKGQHTHTEVDVKSPVLRGILIEINKDVEGLSLLKEPPFVSCSVYRRPELSLRRESSPLACMQSRTYRLLHSAHWVDRVAPGRWDTPKSSIQPDISFFGDKTVPFLDYVTTDLWLPYFADFPWHI